MRQKQERDSIRQRRVASMELRMNRAAAALAAREGDPTAPVPEALRADLAALRDYYEGPLWRADYAADEAGLLPRTLRRGVLSQDALYELLSLADELV